jgi:predicted RNA-binding Zn ribbon-like protein
MERVNERTTRISEQLGDKPAPPALQPVQAFVNTLDVDEGTDLLDEVTTAREWLRDAGILGARGTLNQAQLSEVREVRQGFRAMLMHNNGGPAPSPADLEPLRKLLGSRQPELAVDSLGKVEFEPVPGSDARDGLLGLLMAVRDAQSDGTWSRLKICRNSECLWAFFDRSRNRQGIWCDMAVCGNRLKNRAFRARQR